MSKNKSKKKVVKRNSTTGQATKVVPTVSRRTKTASVVAKKNETLLFNKDNYRLMLIGLGLVFLGLIMMMGGSQPDANTWDDSIIYSKRITVLGPLLILSGLVVEVYAIFFKK